MSVKQKQKPLGRGGCDASRRAVGESFLKTCEALLQGGADPTKGFPLGGCASNANSPAAVLVLAAGAEVDQVQCATVACESTGALLQGVVLARPFFLLFHQKDQNGNTALLIAAAAGNAAFAELMLQHGACVDEVDLKGDFPLAAAARNGHASTCEILLENGADPCQETADGLTALQVGEQQGHELVVSKIEEYNQPRKSAAKR